MASRLGVARTTVTAIEKGQRRVRPAELKTLAGLYGRSIDELVARELPAEPLSVQLRDALASDSPLAAELDEPLFEFQRLCEDYRWLEEISGNVRRIPAPEWYEVDSHRLEASAEDVAVRERLRLGLGDGPVRELRGLLETDVGLRIFCMELPQSVAAFFAFTPELGGGIAVNRSHPPERRLQSLAREYGHFLTERRTPEVAILGRYERVPARERFAEAFGRAFLLPSTGLARRVHEMRRNRGGFITKADLSTLADFYLVSIDVLTRRLEEVGLLIGGTREKPRGQELQVREARAIPELSSSDSTVELLPRRYQHLAVEAFRTGTLTEGQLARVLRMDRVEARRLVAVIETRMEESEEGGPRGPLDFSAGV